MLNNKYQKHGIEVSCSRLILTLLMAAVFLTGPTFAQTGSPVIKINEAAAQAEITTEKLRGGISVLTGSGGNIVVFDGPEGKLLVDAGIGVSRDRIQKALENIGSGPIKYLVNTHWHWDHTDGNEWVNGMGATIIAHENVLKLLSRSERVEDWNYTFQPIASGGLPTVTFKTNKTLSFNGETVVMKNFENGHTDGDISVHFQKADVLVLGNHCQERDHSLHAPTTV